MCLANYLRLVLLGRAPLSLDLLRNLLLLDLGTAGRLLLHLNQLHLQRGIWEYTTDGEAFGSCWCAGNCCSAARSNLNLEQS